MVNKLISVLYGLSLVPQHKLKSHYLSGKTYLSSWCQKEVLTNHRIVGVWKRPLEMIKTNSQINGNRH